MEDEDRLRGLEEIMDKYDYLDDLKIGISGLISELEFIKNRLISFFKTRESVNLKVKNELADEFLKIRKLIGECVERVVREGRQMDRPELRSVIEDMMDKVKDRIRRLRSRLE